MTIRDAVQAALAAYPASDWLDPILAHAEQTLTGAGVSEARISASVRSISTMLSKTQDPDQETEGRLVDSLGKYLQYTAEIETADEGTVKTWVSMADDDVRASHRAAHGQTVAVNETFDVGGQAMLAPHDITADPSEWVNCRCTLRVTSAITAAVEPSPGTIDTEGGAMDDELEGPVPFHGVAVVEGVRTGDMRKFSQGSLEWTDGMDFAWCKLDKPGHDDAVVVGRITRMWREGDELRYEGFYHQTPEADELITFQASDSYRGVSVDVDDSYKATLETLDGKAITAAELEDLYADNEPVVEVYENGRVRGVTVVRIQAFTDAWVGLGPWPEEDLEQPEPDEALVASAAQLDAELETYRDIDESPWDGSASRYTPEQWYKATIVHLSDDKENKSDHKLPILTPEGKLSRAGVHAAASRIGQVDAPDEAIASAEAALRGAYSDLGEDPPDSLTASVFKDLAPGLTEDGPGWLTHPVDTDRLRDYWVRGPGAAKIGWGLPGDFNRCRAWLAQYVKPQYLAGYCANRHKDALGIWPGQHHRGGTDVSPGATIVASARPRVLPASWFKDPQLTSPSPVVVTDEGRIFGHVAMWGQCHVGFPDVCVTAPTSPSGYAFYRTGYVETDEGPIPTGPITMNTDHPDLYASAAAARAHYDNTGNVVANVAAGEDAHGIWVAGAVMSDATPAQIERLRGSALSGDWRPIGVNSEMIAVLACNTQGFPIPRVALAASGGRQLALVAAGVVPNERPQERSLQEIVGEAVSQTLATIRAREQMGQMRTQFTERVREEFRALQSETVGSE